MRTSRYDRQQEDPQPVADLNSTEGLTRQQYDGRHRHRCDDRHARGVFQRIVQFARALGHEPVGGPAQQGADREQVSGHLVTARYSGAQDRDRDTDHCEQDPKDIPSAHPFTEKTTRGDEYEHGLNSAYHRRIYDAGVFHCAEEHGHIAGQKNATEP
jgi:hypothetical protein